ncbi:MerR family transcriptional regulator [Ureibacillus massiliensis 4400831 = CIP 108448 = CCUG 49529]|uniref:MerR family transcriptional regulator n=2 Tax=cellular organisms TaxID=131567 RepID=A0A0A3J7U8_9BACL|nr:MerR family transcriptional regulator [Ureibacillus massiliensis]KGR91238.1 MerR family transcriptional regulator [Ureibacillus massiliensis 4400831 = CIP 108448 = CCUG 49529]
MGRENRRSSELRRSMPLLPMSTVMQLTELSARQIRYYEEHDLIQPHRTEGNRRMFSLNDVDTLLDIKDMLEQGVNMAGIKKVFDMKKNPAVLAAQAKQELSDSELRKVLREEMKMAQGQQKPSLRQGDLSRFYQ